MNSVGAGVGGRGSIYGVTSPVKKKILNNLTKTKDTLNTPKFVSQRTIAKTYYNLDKATPGSVPSGLKSSSVSASLLGVKSKPVTRKSPEVPTKRPVSSLPTGVRTHSSLSRSTSVRSTPSPAAAARKKTIVAAVDKTETAASTKAVVVQAISVKANSTGTFTRTQACDFWH